MKKTIRNVTFWMGKAFLFVICVYALAGGVAHAQAFGTISGTVTDPTGAVLPNVPVVATASQTGAQTRAVTNGHGEFTFPTLLPTQYTVTVTADGFQAYQQSGVVLQAN